MNKNPVRKGLFALLATIGLAPAVSHADPITYDLVDVVLSNGNVISPEFGSSVERITGALTWDGTSISSIEIMSFAGAFTTCTDADDNNGCDISPFMPTYTAADAVTYTEANIFPPGTSDTQLVAATPFDSSMLRIFFLDFESLELGARELAVSIGVEYLCLPGVNCEGIDVDQTPFRASVSPASFPELNPRLVARVPEPGTLPLFITCLFALVLVAHRRRELCPDHRR